MPTIMMRRKTDRIRAYYQTLVSTPFRHFAWIACLTLVVVPAFSPALRQAAERTGMLMGAAVRPEQLSEPLYAATLAREFNMLEPEDALKWEGLHPTPETFDFSQADRIVAFAMSHQMKVRGHTLVWHQQNPRWLMEGRHTQDQLARILEQHIKTVVGHFRGKVFAWDVVNEAFDERVAGKFRSTIWYDQRALAAQAKVVPTLKIVSVGHTQPIPRLSSFTTTLGPRQ